MPIRTRSFSGKLLKRIRSKPKLNEASDPPPVPALPASILPGLDVDTSLGAPFGLTSTTSPVLVPPKLHRRSRSFSELLSIASNSSDTSHAQPWRDREAWAAIHSPSQRPVKSRKEGSIMDRSYGWMERLPPTDNQDHDHFHRRPTGGRDDFKFYHNINSHHTSPDDLSEQQRIRATHGNSRLNDPTTIVNLSRPSSDSSSTISTMDLSVNSHTPPRSTAPHSPIRRSIPRSLASPMSSYSTDDLPLPPLLPHNVKRADSPPAFTKAAPAQIPWAQKSTMRDAREASNLRWATSNSFPASPGGPPFPGPLKNSTNTLEPPRTPEPRFHRRKRSMTAPSVFDGVKNLENDSSLESSALPHQTPSPPRPPRHPMRHLNTPAPSLMPSPMALPLPKATPAPIHTHPSPSHTPFSRGNERTAPLSSPLAIDKSLNKGPPAYHKPTLPLRSAASYRSLRPISRRPATAPTQGSIKQGSVSARQFGVIPYPSPPPPATGFANDRLSRKVSATSSIGQGGWI